MANEWFSSNYKLEGGLPEYISHQDYLETNAFAATNNRLTNVISWYVSLRTSITVLKLALTGFVTVGGPNDHTPVTLTATGAAAAATAAVAIAPRVSPTTTSAIYGLLKEIEYDFDVSVNHASSICEFDDQETVTMALEKRKVRQQVKVWLQLYRKLFEELRTMLTISEIDGFQEILQKFTPIDDLFNLLEGLFMSLHIERCLKCNKAKRPE
jgi:hypothetical protein